MFAMFGEHCYYCSRKIPEEPYLVKIHNNVVLAANVNLVTHDILNDMLSRKLGKKPGEVLAEYNMGTIEIFDNVAIGSDTTILFNTKIGPNAIVAAKVIGYVDELIEKRKKKINDPINTDKFEDVVSYYWKK